VIQKTGPLALTDKKNIKNLVFDLGGVLIDWNPRRLFDSVFTDPGELEYFLTHICSPGWNLQQDAGRSLDFATRTLQAKYPAYHKEIGLYYGSWESMLGGAIERNVELMQAAKGKYKIYALTNWSAETFPLAQKRYSFLSGFDGMVVSGKVKLIKPDPAIYHYLLESFSLLAAECVFIDDNMENVQTASKLGFSVIHYEKETDLAAALRTHGVLV